MNASNSETVHHVFIIGAKSFGQYGGYETFVDKLTEQHSHISSIQYHVACKENGSGCMDETKLVGVSDIVKDTNGKVREFTYHNAHAFKIRCPKLGAACAIYYDIAALRYSIAYCRNNNIDHPIFYILACRIGPFIGFYKKIIKAMSGELYVNPDGHEWMRAKWPAPIKKYWKISETLMVKHADLLVCDSVNIEKYIKQEYSRFNPRTTYIAYGSDTRPSTLSDDDDKFLDWLHEKGLEPDKYYLSVGRFVPENNFETMIREFMNSNSEKNFALITNVNDNFLNELEDKLHYSTDPRIKFVGTVYDAELLKKIREHAYAYFHGHEVGGTNPSLLEALGSTNVNLLLDVGFNREVGQDAAMYWGKSQGNLADLIDRTDRLVLEKRIDLGEMAKKRIREAYSWRYIADEYLSLFDPIPVGNEEQLERFAV